MGWPSFGEETPPKGETPMRYLKGGRMNRMTIYEVSIGQVSSVENQFNKKIVLTGMLCCCQAPKFAVSGTCGAATSGILPCSICCENSSRISCNEKRWAWIRGSMPLWLILRKIGRAHV